MYSEVDIATVAALLADRTRVDLVVALSGGVARPASELAGMIGVSRPVASVHLSHLLNAEVLAVEKHGRHRYYRLTKPEIIEAFESLARLAPRTPVRSLSQNRRVQVLRSGRRCYDHLAGEIGVLLADAIRENGWIEVDGGESTLTTTGEDAFVRLGIDLDAARRRRRPLLRLCLDWSERRHHLAGALAAALFDELINKGWVQSHPTSRAIALTEAGAREMADYFGMAPTTETFLLSGTSSAPA